MTPLRLGLIGAGPWGRNLIKTLAAMPEASLTRIASRNPATQSLAGPDCRVSADWREVAAASDLDGVLIAAPPALHAEMARAAIDAGLPVFVEKPLTMDLEQARGLLEHAKKKKAFVLVDHIQLFHPAYAPLKERARKLGPVKSIASAGGNRGPFHADVTPLWDYGPHDAALALDFLGEKPAEVKARLERSEKSAEGLGENLALELGFLNGVSAQIRIGNLLPRRTRRFEVRFAKQTLVMDDQAPDMLTLHENSGGKPGPGKPIAFEYSPPLQLALEAFAGAVRSGSRDLDSLRLGVDVVAVLDTCRSILARRQPK